MHDPAFLSLDSHSSMLDLRFYCARVGNCFNVERRSARSTGYYQLRLQCSQTLPPSPRGCGGIAWLADRYLIFARRLSISSLRKARMVWLLTFPSEPVLRENALTVSS